jgi:hypothetical protein
MGMGHTKVMKSISGIKLKVLTLSIIIVALVSIFNNPPAMSLQLNPVAYSGQPAPRSGGAIFSGFGQVSMNGLGDIAFNAGLTGGTSSGGVFLFSSGNISAVVLIGQPAAGTNGVFSGFSSPVVNNSGDIAFWAGITGGKSSSGIFLHSNGRLLPVAIAGQVVPGTRFGFISFVNHSLNNSGEVAFTAKTFTPESGNSRAIFLYSEGKISALILPDQKLTEGTRVFLPDFPSLNDTGSMAFVNLVSVAPRGVTSGDGIYLWSNGTVLPIVRRGQITPGTTGVFHPSLGKGMARPSLNTKGSVVFAGSISGGHANEGLFLAAGSSVIPLTLTGNPIPGGGGTFSSFLTTSLNDLGSIAFVAGVDTGAEDLTKRHLRGLFLVTDGVVSTVILEEQNAPPTLGGRVSAINDAILNNQGSLAFVVRLRGGAASEAILLAK